MGVALGIVWGLGSSECEDKHGKTIKDQLLDLEVHWADINGVALDSVQILLNNQDITSECVLSETGFTFKRY